MNRFAMLPLAVAAFAFAPAALANDEDETVLENAAIEAGVATPARLVSWDGDFELMKSSRRMRIWRSHLAYRLTVDAQGEVTDCELTETFRMRRISDRLCEILSAHHHFEPAQNEDGVPVEDVYNSRISYQEMRARL